MIDARVRAPLPGEAAAVADLVNLCQRAAALEPETFVAAYTPEEFQARWRSVGVDTNAWVAVINEDIAGYLDVHVNGQGAWINSASAVHPSYRGLGIGTELIHRAETRVLRQLDGRSPACAPYPISTWIRHSDERARRLLTKEGFQSVGNSVWGMAITLTERPLPASWPPGVTVRAFVPGQDDEAVKRTIEEALQRPFTHWDEVYTNREDFDPTLWHVAETGGAIVGALLCDPAPSMGYIDVFGVRRDWRGKGLGTALLHHAFRDIYDRGLRRVELSVNASNPDAPRLYERAGMRIVDQIDQWRKDL